MWAFLFLILTRCGKDHINIWNFLISFWLPQRKLFSLSPDSAVTVWLYAELLFKLLFKIWDLVHELLITNVTSCIIHLLQCEQSSVAFNGTSKFLVSGGLDSIINIWDIKTCVAKRTYKVIVIEWVLIKW